MMGLDFRKVYKGTAAARKSIIPVKGVNEYTSLTKNNIQFLKAAGYYVLSPTWKF